MLLTKTLKVKWHIKTRKYYEGKGYIFTKYGEEFEVRVENLSDGSNVFVQVKCDCEDCKNPHLPPMRWVNYIRYVKEDGKYYCNACTTRLFAKEKSVKTKLQKSKSFEQWCIENNRQDVIARWDYKLNPCNPNEICYSTSKKFYFICPRGIHKSELKDIRSFTNKQKGSMDCNQCNSVAQYILDTYGKNALNIMSDNEKHKELSIDLWKISHSSPKQVIWIKCQDVDYHGSYKVTCNNFVKGNGCPYCTGKKVHPLDSLGTLKPKSLQYWSDKNEKTPYEYAPRSNQFVWWKCLECHSDYYRDINSSNRRDFRCPECQYSKGEKRVEEYLKMNNIKYISQKEYNGLMGLGGGKLSYDFYLPLYNLLIEYQGEFHDGSSGDYAKINLEKQQEHDKRKKDYAQLHNIKLLEIWYYDFDNIEQILNKEFLNN